MVGLEPSCTALLRSDLPDLVPGPAARRVASSVVTLAELLEPLPLPLHPLGRRAIAQVHCHQHAVMGYAPDQVLLARAGVQVEPLDSGCCGLAGNFGFEPGHVAVSRAAGERVLLPAVRSAPEDTLILADGFSCRTQIAWGIGEAQPAEEDQGSEDAQSSGEGRRVGKERRGGNLRTRMSLGDTGTLDARSVGHPAPLDLCGSSWESGRRPGCARGSNVFGAER